MARRLRLACWSMDRASSKETFDTGIGRTNMTKFRSMALFAALLATLGGTSQGALAHSEREIGSLAPTGIDADARGRAKLRVRNGDDGTFEVIVQKLDGEATYQLVVNGVLVGEITTSRGGNGRARFRSRPRSSRDSLLGFDPRGALVSVRNSAGQDVLAVTLASGGGSQSGDVICCIPDDSGPECEDRTPAECAAQGGTVSTATSCLPNPCTGTPPPTSNDIICCLPDDSGPECEDRTADECAAQGGVAVEATSCNPNPCAAVVPPAGDDVQCCLADDSGPKCEDRTLAQCAVEGGVSAGAGACSLDSCASLPPPPSNATVTVRCERRSGRSKVSVDGNNLPTASYQARVTSGGNSATSPARPTVGDEAEFDFDSDGGDIAAGATAIAPSFITGTPPVVTGSILSLSGAVIVEATATCLDR